MKDSPSLLRVGIGCKLLRDTCWKGGEVVDHFIQWIACDYLEAALCLYEVLIILGSPIEANESVKHLCPESEEASLTRDLQLTERAIYNESRDHFGILVCQMCGGYTS